MAKKILSVILAVVMIAALCTVAFAAEDSATITLGSQTITVPVGETFQVKKSLILPEGYAAQGGRFILTFDTTKLEVQEVENEDGDLVYYLTDGNFLSPADTATGFNVGFASDTYKKSNYLNAGKDNLFTVTLKVIAAGDVTITEDEFDLGVFSEQDKNKVIDCIKNRENISDIAVTATTLLIYAGEPEPTEPPTDEPTEAPTDKPTEAPTDKPTEAPTQAPTDKPATVDDLKGLVAEAGKLDSGKYSKEDWQKVQDAIKAAQAVIADPNATPEQIAEAYAKLAAAMGKTTSSTETVAPTKKPSKSDTPKTGEAATSVFVLLAVLVMAAGVVIVARKRATK